MMDLTKLINLLPYYFKENDTYKDAQDKGILERFLEICGNYFENEVIANIESLLDNLSVENCPEHFLSYLWEWFGCIPFAEGDFIDPDKWAQYYNGFDDKDTYEGKKHYWTFNDTTNPLPLSIEQKRRILKYAISLLKCRGSKVFFETMFRLYGIDLIGIYDHAIEDVKNIEGSDVILAALPSTVDLVTPTMDDDLLLMDKGNCMDEQENCMQCIPAYFYIRYTGDNKQGFYKAITNFINKYIPFNARPIIKIIDGKGEDIIGDVFYIRVTNVQTGESYMDSSISEGGESNLSFTSTSNFKLFFRVETWSTSDPSGNNSSWFYIKNGESYQAGVTPVYPSNTVKAIYESSTGDESIEYLFYNKQALDAGISNTTVIAVNLRVVSVAVPGYYLDIEVYRDNELIAINPTTPISLRNIEIRVNALKYENIYDLSKGSELVPIWVYPSVNTTLKNDRYILDTINTPGQYRVSIAEMPNIFRTLNLIKDNLEYRVRCVDSQWQDIETLEIPAASGSTVKCYVIIEPTDETITDYSEVIGTEIQCINTGISYTVTRLDSNGHYGIEFITRFEANFRFRSLANTNIENEDLWDSIDITKLGNDAMGMILEPKMYNVDLKDGEVTVRFNLTIQYSSGTINFAFSDNPVQNGAIRIQVFEGLNSSSEADYKDKWFGSNNPGNNIQVIKDDNTHAHFDIVIPKVNDPQYEDIPYTGVLQVSYLLPNVPSVGSIDRVFGPSTVIVGYTAPSGGDMDYYVAIIPFNSGNTGNTGWQVDWSQAYPNIQSQVGEEITYYPMITNATYKKASEDDACKFTLEVSGYSRNQEYTQYDIKTNDIISTGEIEDVTETISFVDPGKYVFDIKGDNHPDGVIVTVEDFVSTFKVTCNPSSAYMSSSFSPVSTKVSLNITPDKSTYSHQVRVFKDGIDTGIILFCSTPQDFTASEPGTYTFRSIDAENELSEEELSDSWGTFEVYDSSSIVDKIVCDPDSDTIDENTTKVSTVVRLYGKDGQEIRDSAFLIKFPNNSNNVSGTTFTTSEPGTYTFTLVNNPDIKGTFEAIDGSYKPKFGGVYIDPNEQTVSSWPFNSNIDINFTAWDTQAGGQDIFSIGYKDLKDNQLEVGYRSIGSEGEYISIPLASPTGARFVLHDDDEGDNRYRVIISGLTLEEDTEIRIRSKDNSEFSTDHDIYSIKAKDTTISSIVLDNYEGNNTYPGISNVITGVINKSDGSQVDHSDWSLNYLNNTKVYLDGEELTRINENPSEGQWAPAIPSGSKSIQIQVYLTQAQHNLYITIQSESLITSNTITINSEEDMTDKSFIFFSDINGTDQWNSPSLSYEIVREGRGMDSSVPFWLTGGYEVNSRDLQVNNEPYKYLGSGSDIILKDLDLDTQVNSGQEFTGVHNFQIEDNTKGSPILNFQMVNYPSRNFQIQLEEYEEMTYPINTIFVYVRLQNSLSSSDTLNVQVDYDIQIGYTKESQNIPLGWAQGQISLADDTGFHQTPLLVNMNLTDPNSLHINFYPQSGMEERISKVDFTYIGGNYGGSDDVTFDIEGTDSRILYSESLPNLRSNQSVTIVPSSYDIAYSYQSSSKSLSIYLDFWLRN